MTYTLEKEPNAKGGLVEKWIPYKPMQFEKDDMPLRQEQLQIRTRECSQTLDLLFKLDEGVELEHILHSPMNLGAFKVFIARKFKRLSPTLKIGKINKQGVMDLSTPVIAGHSFGSATLLRTLAADKRFK